MRETDGMPIRDDLQYLLANVSTATSTGKPFKTDAFVQRLEETFEAVLRSSLSASA